MILDPALVARVQRRVGVAADGILGPATLAAIDARLAAIGEFQTSGPREVFTSNTTAPGPRIVLEASRYLGLTEVVGNRKWDLRATPGADPIADELVRVMLAAGWQPGWPYCAAFVEAVWRTVYRGTAHLEKIAAVLNPHCLTSWRNAQRAGMTTREPTLGAVGIMQLGSTDRGHAFIVEKVPGNGWLHTIEANTSPAPGSAEAERNGDGIYRRTRILDFHVTPRLHLLGFITPPN